MRDILFVAGEASGDLHAAGVAHELRARNAAFQLVGIGGDEMRGAGVHLIEHVERLAVMGFVEV
ncbi:MAG: lipid-A-disaccharide synthase, partial [Gemmatimonadetes bacterium]